VHATTSSSTAVPTGFDTNSATVKVPASPPGFWLSRLKHGYLDIFFHTSSLDSNASRTLVCIPSLPSACKAAHSERQLRRRVKCSAVSPAMRGSVLSLGTPTVATGRACLAELLSNSLYSVTTGRAGIPSQMPRGSVKLSAILVGTFWTDTMARAARLWPRRWSHISCCLHNSWSLSTLSTWPAIVVPASASTMRGTLLPAVSSSISRSKAATSIFCWDPNRVLHGTGRTQYIGSPSWRQICCTTPRGDATLL